MNLLWESESTDKAGRSDDLGEPEPQPAHSKPASSRAMAMAI